MFRLKTVVFVLITFAGVSIGANNMTRFQQGQNPLADRTAYCEWISADDQVDVETRYTPTTVNGVLFPTLADQTYERLWKVSDKLKPYLSRQVVFTHLPHPVQVAMNREAMKLQRRVDEIKATLNLLQANVKELETTPPAELATEQQYRQWKLTNELPAQITHLTAEKAELTKTITDLEKLRMNDIQAYRYFRLAYQEEATVEGLPLPTLALEVELDPGWVTSTASLYPVWVENGHATRASTEPYLTLRGSMIPRELTRAFADQKLPSLYQVHRDLMANPPTEGDESPSLETQNLAQVEFLTPNRLLIKGTPYSNRQPTSAEGDRLDLLFTSTANLAIDGLFDLGCMANSKWARRLVTSTESFLADPSLAKTYSFNTVDPKNLKILDTLKSLNQSAPTRTIAQAPTPHFWERFLAF